MATPSSFLQLEILFRRQNWTGPSAHMALRCLPRLDTWLDCLICLALKCSFLTGFFQQCCKFVVPIVVGRRIGAAMSTLVRAGYFGRGGVKARLHVATVKMRAWCRRNGRSTALRKFTQDNLVLKDKSFPETFLYI